MITIFDLNLVIKSLNAQPTRCKRCRMRKQVLIALRNRHNKFLELTKSSQWPQEINFWSNASAEISHDKAIIGDFLSPIRHYLTLAAAVKVSRFMATHGATKRAA